MNHADQLPEEIKRAAFFIDGFNLYHAIDDLEMPHLKWVSYCDLARAMMPRRSEALVGVTWCTARHAGNSAKGDRHDVLCRAQFLQTPSVEILKGHFVQDRSECRNCDDRWSKPVEKEGDINVAISLIRGAFKDEYDHAYLVTADTDQVATVRMFKREFPNKKLTVVFPAGREGSKHLIDASEKRTIKMTIAHLERAVMPQIVLKEGVGSVRRPLDYAPPDGWVHPTARPK